MQSTLPLSSLPLALSHINKLSAAGFETVGDLKDVGIVDLSKEAILSHSEALEVLRVVRECGKCGSDVGGSDTSVGVSALELLRSEVDSSHVVTFSSQVDSILGGGVPVGKITEVCGAPGIGKTQFCMQLAVDVAIPEVFGGLGGEAVYIDTEGSFVVDRVADMARAAVAHLTSVAQSNQDQEMETGLKDFTLEKVLSGLHYYRCHDYVELVALIHLLSDVVKLHPKVKLVVLDSIASPFRYGFQDMGLRNRILSGVAQSLIQLAITKRIAVILTNQMTTRFGSVSGKSGAGQLAPALGESWGHVATIRMVLHWSDGVRHAWLVKSPNKREQVVPFQITGDGVRDNDQLDSDSVPPMQLPPTEGGGEDEFDCDCLDELMLEVPDCQLAEHSKPLKRKLQEETSELSESEFMSAGQQLPKRPHPEH